MIELLGEGGFGHTFLAEDLHLPDHPHCVVKQLKPQANDSDTLQTARRLFETEAQVLYQLGNHDQIPRLLAHFEENKEFYLALEFIEGEPLSETFASGELWSEASVITLLQDILQVLTFVHQQNVIHRDVKPSNLLRRCWDGKIVLIDFGAVKQTTAQLADPDADPTVTISIGTPGYLPNEQMAGNPRFSSDVYAVGMIGIQALTGIKPKKLDRDPHTGEIVWQHRAKQLSPELAAVLDRMVSYHFKDRYQTAAEALKALEALLGPHRNLAELKATPSPPHSGHQESSDQDFDRKQRSLVALPKQFQGLNVGGVIKRSLSQFRSTLPLQKPRFNLAVASRFAPILQKVQAVPRKAFIGIGLFAIATIVPLSQLNSANRDRQEAKPPNFQSAAVAPSIPPLPCNEPPLPPLPARSPDYEYHDGTKYYGKFVDGIPANGRGIMLFQSGNRYDGEFRDGKRNGCGTLTFANGKHYMGQFQSDRFNGQGVWTSGNGDRYIGAFKNNKCHGKGVLIFANGTFQNGVWQDGKLVGKNLFCHE